MGGFSALTLEQIDQGVRAGIDGIAAVWHGLGGGGQQYRAEPAFARGQRSGFPLFL